jgi:hypothetical protein
LKHRSGKWVTVPDQTMLKQPTEHDTDPSERHYA